MAKNQRYNNAMRHDFPKDFIPDDEWAFIDSLAAAKGDGIKNKSNTACRMLKSGKENKMARSQTEMEFTVQQKCDYFSRRANDTKLSEGQRRYAQRRLGELRGGRPSKKTVACPTCNTPVSAPSGKYTDGQKYAYGAGVGYGRAKSGQRVDCKDENKASFRKGFERGKRK